MRETIKAIGSNWISQNEVQKRSDIASLLSFLSGGGVGIRTRARDDSLLTG